MASKFTEQFQKDLKRYLSDEMTGIELKMFENRLKEDAQLREDLKLFIELSETIHTKNDDVIFKNQFTEKEINTLKSKLQQTTFTAVFMPNQDTEEVTFGKKKKASSFSYLVITGVILFSLVLYFMLTPTSYKSYYDTHINWEDLPSFIEKGKQKSAFSKGELAFKQKRFEDAVIHFKKINSKDKLYIESVLYLGAAYDQLNQNKKAIATFQKLSKLDDSYESSKGIWYEAMIHLKMENKSKAIFALSSLIDNSYNYKYEEAKILLRRLE